MQYIPKYKRILRKLALVLLVLVMIYFSVGGLSALVIIVIEATTHQMSSEIQQDTPGFQPWIIYGGMIFMMLITFGFAFGAFKAHQAIKKIGKPKDDIPKEIEVY